MSENFDNVNRAAQIFSVVTGDVNYIHHFYHSTDSSARPAASESIELIPGHQNAVLVAAQALAKDPHYLQLEQAAAANTEDQKAQDKQSDYIRSKALGMHVLSDDIPFVADALNRTAPNGNQKWYEGPAAIAQNQTHKGPQR